MHRMRSALNVGLGLELNIPDNPQDFSGSLWQPLPAGGVWASLSAHPAYGLFGNLKFTPNASGNDLSGTYLGTIAAPQCESDTQFIKNLVSNAQAYGNNLPYSYPNYVGYMPPGTYNSDSFISGLLRASGVTPPLLFITPNFQVPGYYNPVPIH